jgi:hypothetical protein
MLKMACIKDTQLFSILEQHAEQLKLTKFQAGRHPALPPFLNGGLPLMIE